MLNSNNLGRSSAVGSGVGGRDDNNLASIRNPPGAFHNSGSALAQFNMLGYIIKQIKMQSVGTLKSLSIFLETFINNASAAMMNFLKISIQNVISLRIRWLQWWVTIDGNENHKMQNILQLQQQQKEKGKEKQKQKKKDVEAEYQLKMSMKIKMVIELCGYIGNWYWHSVKAILQLLMAKATTTKSTRTRTTEATTATDMILEQTVIIEATATKVAACSIDNNSYNGHINEDLHRYDNNNNNENISNNNNNIKNKYMLSKNRNRYRYRQNRQQQQQQNYIGQSTDNNCSSSRSGQQIISNNNHITTITDDNNNDDDGSSGCDGVGNNSCVAKSRTLLTPLAAKTCLLLLLLLLFILFPPALHFVYVGLMRCSFFMLWLLFSAHFISILLLSLLTKFHINNNNKQNTCNIKINKLLSFNSDQYLYAIGSISVMQKQQQQQQQQIQSFKLTKATLKTTEASNTIFNIKEALR